MTSPAVQLSFSLRTSANARSVHLVGSWDGYKGQLPLSVDSAGKPGSWKGTFRFQGSHALKLGSRYWYYYVVDGYHVSHDPAKEFTTEKTTGRKLNILNVPLPKKVPPLSVTTSNLPAQRANPDHVPSGRSLSPSRILHPKPTKAYASRQIREADYERSPIDDLEGSMVKFSLNEHLASQNSRRPGSGLSNVSSELSSEGSSFSDISDSSSDSDEVEDDSASSSESDSESETEAEYTARMKELARRGQAARSARVTTTTQPARSRKAIPTRS